MKIMKALLAVLGVLSLLSAAAKAEIQVQFLDEGEPETVLLANAAGKMRASASNPAANIVGREGVLIASLCASTSPNVGASRVNAMAGMVGALVPTDRTSNPAAWYLVGTSGLKSFDYKTTTFVSWLGSTQTTSATSSEHGHRVVVHALGKYPVSAYTCRISSSDAMIGSTTFPVGVNTSTGAELTFSSTFVGINVGANGTLDSHIDPSTGQWVQGGDDVIFTNGERPSQVSYTWWYRFGATATVTVSDPSLLQSPGGQWIKAELMRNQTLVDTETVGPSLPKLVITKANDSSFNINIVGGQGGPYKLFVATGDINSGWTQFGNESYFSGGNPIPVPKRSANQFFRLQGN